MNNLEKERKVIGSIIEVWLLTLLVLTLCTCSGPRLTLGNLTLENQTDYSTYSGKLVKQTRDVMECPTSKTDDLDFLLWLPAKLLTKQQYLQMLDLEYCPNLGVMQRKCLQTKLYQYRLTIHSSLNQSRMGWTVPKQNLPTEFPHQSLQERNLTLTSQRKTLLGSIPQSTGKTRVTTHTMVKN